MAPPGYVPSYYAASAHAAPEHPAAAGLGRCRRVRRGRRHRRLLDRAAPGRARHARGSARGAAHRLGRLRAQRRPGDPGDRLAARRSSTGSSARRPRARSGSIGVEGLALMRALIRRYSIDCDWVDGHLHAAVKPRHVAELQAELAELRDATAIRACATCRGRSCARSLATDRYLGALYDSNSGHLHPLNYTLGLAAAAESQGVQIYRRHARAVASRSGQCQVRIATPRRRGARPLPGPVRQRLPRPHRPVAGCQDHGGRHLHRRDRAAGGGARAAR